MLLKKGSEGTEVANWQRFLISQGFHNIEADGDFGPKTEVATKVFQRQNLLDADGKVGPDTLAKAESLPKQNISSSNLPPKNLSDDKLSKVHPRLAAGAQKIIELARSEGYAIKVSQGLRTFAEQDKLFRQRPVVTRARGGQSMHNYGLAVDFVFVVDGKVSWDDKLYRNIGRWATQAGLEWGGNWKSFKDMPHCQLPDLPSYKVLLPIYNAGGIEAVWEKY